MSNNPTFEPIGQLSRHELKKRAEDCCETDILACDVYSVDGEKLVSAYTIVTDYIKSVLVQNRIHSVTVYSSNQSPCHYSQSPDQYYRHICNIKSAITHLSAGFCLKYDSIIALMPHISKEITAAQSYVIISYLKQLQKIDHYSFAHSQNVGAYSLLLAHWLGLSHAGCATALQAGLLHDIGKIEIPINLLKKEAALTHEEFELIKKHPIYSYMKLIDCPSVSFAVRQAVLQHHERLDRSGYPMATDDISIYAGIVAIADVYDAMTTDRVYKKGVTPFKAFEFFQHQGREMFEQCYLKVFIENMSSFLVGVTIQTTSGDLGRIVYSPPDTPFKPIVAHNENAPWLRYYSEEIAKISI